MTNSVYLVRFGEWFDVGSWPLAALVPDGLADLPILPPDFDPATGELRLGFFLGQEMVLRLAGIDAFALVLSPAGGGTLVRFTVTKSPFSATLHVPMVLRVDTAVLCPVDGDDRPDTTSPTLDVALGEVDLTVTADGHVAVDVGTVSLPRCMVARSGVIVEVGALRWLSPATASVDLPAGTPAGFTGVYLDDAVVTVAQLPDGAGTLRLDDGFLGTGGFTGRVAVPDLGLDWDPGGRVFTGAVVGDVLGFAGGLASIELEFRQSALVGCVIAGDVVVPWLDAVLGLELGLTGAGEVTAQVRVPHSPGAAGVTPGGDHLVEVDVYGVLSVAIDAIAFARPSDGPPLIELTGALTLDIPGLALPAVGVQALRIDTDGHIAVDGGWLDVPTGTSAPFHGFPLEISRLGFGTEPGAGGANRMWVGLSGAITLADGLPVGGSVEGLRVAWEPTDPVGTLAVTLSGVGIALDVPGVVAFAGSVSFFDDGVNQGFRGSGHLSLPTVGVAVDANVVIGRNAASGNTFFYFHLGVDLPVGIPLFNTGLAFYGFEGLVANGMGPDRAAGEPWYWGWYVRDPRGATDQSKWAVRPGAFAAGLGTTIGTLPDTGFTASAKVLLVLVLPGPVLLLEGKGSLLRERPSGAEEAIFDALLSLDVPAKLFQANFGATYFVENLITLHGGAELAFSWASPLPPGFWHVYLGEDQPSERRWRADLLSIFQADAYFMIEPDRIRFGAWVGFEEEWSFGPVHVRADAEISGDGEVSIDPQHLHGQMHLDGTASVSAYGVEIGLGATADFDVDGPTPWRVEFAIDAHIEIDLWLVDFSWRRSIELSWVEPVPRDPEPALPLVTVLGHQHPVVDAGGALEQAVIAPDAHQVVVFRRPVHDRGDVGAPLGPAPAPEVVGPAQFRYQLGHVALHRRRGNRWHVVAARGMADVGADGVVALPGLALSNPEGGLLTLRPDDGAPAYPVTAVGAQQIEVEGDPPLGPAAYQLSGTRPTAEVQVTAVAPLGGGLVLLTLGGATGTGRDELGGGILSVAGGQEYRIAGNQGSTIVVRTAPTASAVPPVGPATALGPEGPRLTGVWLPDDDGAATTTLVIGARTPFARFRNTVAETTHGWVERNPGYVCGPTPRREPTCIRFDGAAPGPLGADSVQVGPLAVAGSGDAAIAVAEGPPGGLPTLVVRLGDGARGTRGTATFRFPGPVDQARVFAAAEGEGRAVAIRDGAPIAQIPLTRSGRPIRFAGPLDAVVVDGVRATVSEICFEPDWTCLTFDPAAFPQGGTGRHDYAGVTLESSGRMRVLDGVLRVTAPGRSRPPWLPDPLLLRVLPTTGDAHSGHQRPADAALPAQAVLPEIPGLTERSDVILPGLGRVGANPPTVPAPRRGRARGVAAGAADAARTVRLRRDLRERGAAPLPPADRVLFGTAVFPRIASVTVYFPRPVTRVRVVVEQDANVTLGAGAALIATAVATPGSPVDLHALDGWADRVTVSASPRVDVREICTDAGKFGWQRYEQWAWRTSMRRSLSAFVDESPLLAPGTYRLDVVTGWSDDARAGDPTSWTTSSATFEVGAPPGLRTDVTGPLNDLATYIADTMPAAGERPFYRTYDIGVAFRRDYVSRMFLENATPLLLGVLDDNGRTLRAGSPNVWGRDVDLNLTAEETDWLATLHGDGRTPCASIDTSKVMRTELVHAGAGEPLLPARRHTGVLSTDSGSQLFTFDFVTSRYTSFAHHIAAFGSARFASSPSNLDVAALRAITAAAEQALATSRVAVETATQAVSAGIPTAATFTLLADSQTALAAAIAARDIARGRAFAAAAEMSGISPTRPRPTGVEVTVVAGGFLVESDEPIQWDRIQPELRYSSVQPLQTETIDFDPAALGRPDAGTFGFARRRWHTTAELWAASGIATAILGGPWTLAIELEDVIKVDVEVAVADDGSCEIRGSGVNVSVGEADGTRSLTGAPLTRCEISGTDFGVHALTLTSPYQTTAGNGPVLICAAVPPMTSGDADHHITLLAHEDVALDGWRVQWRHADAQGPWETYHLFAPGTAIPAGQTARIEGGRSSGATDPNSTTWFGGTTGTLPADGIVARLMDANGTVVHERAALPTGAAVAYDLIPDADLTRAYLVPATLTPGWWTLDLIFHRDVGPTQPHLSVAGNTAPEIASFSFAIPLYRLS